MVLKEEYGKMVAYRHPNFAAVTFKEAISKPNLVTKRNSLVNTARGLGISLGF